MLAHLAAYCSFSIPMRCSSQASFAWQRCVMFPGGY
jgi:hypothetical protein